VYRAERELEASGVSVVPPKHVRSTALPHFLSTPTLPVLRKRDIQDENEDSDNNDIDNTNIDTNSNSNNTNTHSHDNNSDGNNSDSSNNNSSSSSDSSNNSDVEDEDKDEDNMDQQERSPKKAIHGRHEDEERIRDRHRDRYTARKRDEKFNNLSGEADSMDSNQGRYLNVVCV
jgi:hypothetical protein